MCSLLTNTKQQKQVIKLLHFKEDIYSVVFIFFEIVTKKKVIHVSKTQK